MYQDFFKTRHFVKFRLTGQTKERYWQIVEREPFVFDTGSHSEFSSVATGSNSGFVTIEYLEPAENELYHVIPSIKDGCTYYMKLFVGKDSLGVSRDTDIGYINNIMSPYFQPNPQWGFYTAIKNQFQIRANNDTGSAVTPKVYFQGMKYRIIEVPEEHSESGKEPTLYEKLEMGRIPYTKIQIGGFSN